MQKQQYLIELLIPNLCKPQHHCVLGLLSLEASQRIRSTVVNHQIHRDRLIP
ncbi:hypothetical protein [Acaryochloris sp. CCMEE 5410]|uniref:hypothetical protein n=1 Tax=Acaryochloris sp. CCMEE 5410 TaxID=310037 RepID=UPI0002484BC3|nr:hypothetical protein [Acaryochloris sp. CCMEE 5410]KAI9130341.1 hypothetical protein ON05_021110 [Acaryochloris sp. CCMEE 5410]